MPTLLDRAGRLLLHLREADHGLTEGRLALRAAEPVADDLAAHLRAGIIHHENGAYHRAPTARAEMDRWLAEELAQLGNQDRLYFAYGSNPDPEQMITGSEAQVPSARFLCRARLPGHMLAFPRRSTRYGAWVAGLVPTADGEGAWGVIYLVDAAGLAALDRHEGHPRNYTRETRTVLVRLARSDQPLEVPVQVYLHVNDGSGGGPPAADYLDRLIRGAEAFDLPVWVRELLYGTEVVSGNPAPAATAAPAPGDGERAKYAPLVRYLDGQDKRELRLTFAELEQILGFALPPSARTHAALWYPSDTHRMAPLLAQSGWRATPHPRDEAASFRRKWDEAPLLSATARRLSEVDAALFRRLYEWAKEHGTASPGGGRDAGFTFNPTGGQHEVFTASVDGTITVRFGWLCRSLPVERVEALRVALAGLPGVRGMDEEIRADLDQHGTVPLEELREGWEGFLVAVGYDRHGAGPGRVQQFGGKQRPQRFGEGHHYGPTLAPVGEVLQRMEGGLYLLNGAYKTASPGWPFG